MSIWWRQVFLELTGGNLPVHKYNERQHEEDVWDEDGEHNAADQLVPGEKKVRIMHEKLCIAYFLRQMVILFLATKTMAIGIFYTTIKSVKN